MSVSGGLFGDTNSVVSYTGAVESYDPTTRTFVVHWPEDDTETEMDERLVRAHLSG